MRRIFVIAGFALLVVGIGIAIYFVFFRGAGGPTNNANVGNANTNIGGFPVTNGNVNGSIVNFTVNGNVNVGGPITNAVLPEIDTIARGGKTLTNDLSQQSIMAPSIGPDGKSVVFYDPITGLFYELSPDGKTKRQLSDQRFPNAEKISWAPDGTRAIVTFPDGSKVLYDFSTKQQVTLPREWDNIVFSGDGTKIGFKDLQENVDNRWLSIANPDGSSVQSIEPIGDKGDDVQVAWSPTSQVIALFREGSSGSTQEVFPIGQHGENFKSFAVDGRGFEGAWSPKGDRLLYNVFNAGSDYKPTLWIVDASGDNIGNNNRALGVQTWANKCVFSSDNVTIFCAVPSDLPEGAALYPDIAQNVPDTFYRINTQTGLRTVLAQPVNAQGGGSYTVRSPFLSEGEQNLYFTDSLSGRLYTIQLK